MRVFLCPGVVPPGPGWPVEHPPTREIPNRSSPMCSIFGIFGLQAGDDLPALRRHALELSQRQRHRGPDWSGVYLDEGALLVHERLAIVDPVGGSQPLLSADGQLALAVNGEIYNHQALKAALTTTYDFQPGSGRGGVNAAHR